MLTDYSSEKTFLNLMQAHKGILHKVARLYMDSPEDREDLQQEIMIQLWKSYQNFKGDSAFSYFKKEKRRSDVYDYSIAKEPENEDYNPEKDRQLEIFYLAVQQLNSVEKALIFYFMEGLSHRETGFQLGISEGNVRVKLNRTKEKLQQIIKKTGYES